jgi:predicted RNase H-like nuclease (RuvC/YqgF family)
MKRAFSLSELHESLDDAGNPSPMRRVKSQDNMLRAIPESNASRVPVLSERELREHFNMPLNEVAKKYGMCTTALKKLCRKYGVMQWPHRKLRSLEKKIASLRAEQRYTSDGQGQLDEEIRKLEAHREALISGSGEGADDEAVGGGWSPTAMSPVDLSEFGEVVKHEGDDREGFFPRSQYMMSSSEVII